MSFAARAKNCGLQMAYLVIPMVMGIASVSYGRPLAFGRPPGGFSLHSAAEDSLSGPQIKTKSPMGAMVRSGLVPGWGQLYNEQYLKSGLVLLMEGMLIGGAVVEHQRAEDDLQESKDVSKNDEEREAAWLRYSRRIDKRNTYLWYLAGAHFLNIVDAYVDAHLYRFDEGPFAVGLETQTRREPDIRLVLRYELR